MEILKAVILGIVQGATEFLPISSSGHLSVFQHFMGMSGEGSLFLTVMLHIGTLIAVIIVYYKIFWELIKELGKCIRDIFTGKFSFTKNLSETRQMLFMLILSCVPLLLILIPVGNGMRLKDIVSGFAEDNDIILEGCCFLFTSFLLLFGSYKSRKNKDPKPNVNVKTAFAVGFAQFVAACLPGVSRSGSTISTGMICGVDKDYMVKYSFVLGTPAILAAAVMEIKDAAGTSMVSSAEILPVIIGIITAMVVGIAAIKLLEWLVNKNKFQFFGYYCLVIGIAVVIAGIVERF